MMHHDDEETPASPRAATTIGETGCFAKADGSSGLSPTSWLAMDEGDAN